MAVASIKFISIYDKENTCLTGGQRNKPTEVAEGFNAHAHELLYEHNS